MFEGGGCIYIYYAGGVPCGYVMHLCSLPYMTMIRKHARAVEEEACIRGPPPSEVWAIRSVVGEGMVNAAFRRSVRKLCDDFSLRPRDSARVHYAPNDNEKPTLSPETKAK